MNTAARDPNFICVGMATVDGNMTETTRVLWERLEKPIGPYRFKTVKVKNYSTAKARNIITSHALRSDAGKLLMLDSDMNVGEQQVLRILSHKHRLVGGLYPRKQIGFRPEWVCNFSGSIAKDGLAPCIDVGAGFLAIDMSLVEEMTVNWPKLKYLCDNTEDRGEPMWDLWSHGVVEDTWNGPDTQPWPRYLTEDFYFCWRARQLDVQPYVDTVCQCGHLGTVDFLEVIALVQELTGERKSEQAPRVATQPRVPLHT